MMKKTIIIAAVLLLLLDIPGKGGARVNININIPLPPPFVFAAPPEMVVIPETYVYYSPDVGFDIFFYDGYWYRPYDRYWYRSVEYSGPWVHIGSPPTVLLRLPPDYRVATREYRRIPYGELHRNWRAWERGRYWEHHNWGRLENERHHGIAPSFREGGPERHHGLAPQFRERGGGSHGGDEHKGETVHGGGGHDSHERR
jgi:hypothetical protein